MLFSFMVFSFRTDTVFQKKFNTKIENIYARHNTPFGVFFVYPFWCRKKAIDIMDHILSAANSQGEQSFFNEGCEYIFLWVFTVMWLRKVW